MTGIRRTLILTGLTLAVLVGASLPAMAGFGASTGTTAHLATATVQPPTALSTAGSWCFIGYGAHLSWTPSSTAGVTGYTVTEYFGDGSSSVVAELGANATKFKRETWMNGRTHSFTVTTQTSYGWTAESARTAGYTC